MKQNRIKLGRRVKWNDPEIKEYDEEDIPYLVNRIFIVDDIIEDDEDDDRMVRISEEGGGSEAEVWEHELVPVEPQKVFVLTCVNEDEVVVWTRVYNTLEAAQKKMQGAYECEKAEAEASDDLISADYAEGRLWAQICYNNEFRYTWEINMAEVE